MLRSLGDFRLIKIKKALEVSRIMTQQFLYFDDESFPVDTRRRFNAVCLRGSADVAFFSKTRHCTKNEIFH